MSPPLASRDQNDTDAASPSRHPGIGIFAFLWRFLWLVARHWIPRYLPRFLPLLVAIGLAHWLGVSRLDADWAFLPPLGVLIFGGIGHFALRATQRDLLVIDLVERDLVERRRPPGRRLGAVHGSIRALGEPLVSPLSEIECVAYKYAITIPGGGDSASGYEPAYLGYHLAPTEIAGSERTFRLLAFPNLHPFESVSASRVRARRHVREITPQPAIPLVDTWPTEDRLRREPRESVAIDLHLDDVRDWTKAEVEEQALVHGTRACVIGEVDDEAGAILPPFRHTGHSVWIYPGSPRSVLTSLRDESRLGAGCAVLFVALGLTSLLMPVSPVVALAAGALLLTGLGSPRTVIRWLRRTRIGG